MRRLLPLGVLAILGCALLGTIGQAATPRDSVVVLAGAPAADRPVVAGELHEPFGVDLDKSGNLYIAQLGGGQVMRLDSKGRLSVFAGTGAKGYSGDGGPAAQAQFNGMHNLAVLPNGDVLVADTWNCCVRRIDARSGVITTVAGSGKKGFSGDGGPATQADSGGLYCITFDSPRNRLLMADLDNRRIRVVNLTSGTIDTLAGNGQRGVPSDGSLAKDSPLVDPRAVTGDAAGNVYILERGGNAVRVVDSKGRIRTVAGSGKKGPSADNAPALEATFNGPKHLCVDLKGDVIIADAENHVVRKLLVRQGRVIRIAGTGKRGAGGIGGPALSVELNRPHGVYVDPKGSLYIADSYNQRVLKLTAPGR